MNEGIPTVEKVEFDIEAYQDLPYEGPEDHNEPGFVPFFDRPREKKPAFQVIRALEDAGFKAKRLFDEKEGEAQGLSRSDKPVVGTVWTAPNGVELLIEPVGMNPGKDDAVIIYGRKEAGGNFENITTDFNGLSTISSEVFRYSFRNSLVFRYNFLKNSPRKFFYYDPSHFDGTSFPEDFDRK